MRWNHPVLKAGNTWWDQELFPGELFTGRLDEVRSLLRRLQVDALLAYGDATCYGHLTYLSHYLPKHRGGMVVVPVDDPPVLIIEAGSKEIAWAHKLGPTEVVLSASFDGVAPVLAKVLAGLGPTPRLATAGLRTLIRTSDWEELTRLRGSEPQCVDATDELMALRQVKAASEQKAMARAAALVTAGFASGLGVLAAGISVDNLAAASERAMRRLGAEDQRSAIAVSPDAEPWMPTGQTLAATDSVQLCLAAAYQRYWAEAARTFWLGTEPPLAGAVAEAHATALSHLRLGEMASETIARLDAYLNPVRELGATAQFALASIGLDLNEPIGSQPLSPGMTLVLRTKVAHPSAGGILLADTIQLTADGARVLTREANTQ